jgi:hypothetical protein
MRKHGFNVPVIIDDWQTSEGAVKLVLSDKLDVPLGAP